MLRSFFFCCLLFCLCHVFSTYGQNTNLLLKQGKDFLIQNDYVAAQKSLLQALQQAEQRKQYSLGADASLHLARCHYYLYDRKAAFYWSHRSLQIIRQHHIDSLLASAYYFLGALHIEAEHIDSAEFYSFKAIELMLKKKDYVHLSQTYSTLVELHLNTSKNRNKIESYLNQADHYGSLSGNQAMMAFAASKRYNYAFFMKHNYPEALQHINKAESLYLKSSNREAILNTFRAKAECLILLKDTSARSYMMQWFSFKDSILQAKKSASIAKYETLYQTEKKIQENKLLQQEIKFNRFLLLLIAIVLLLILTLAVWWINRNKLKKKRLELLLLKNLQSDKERIARDLHDHIGGQLSFMLFALDGLEEESLAKRKEVSASINESVRSVISSLRETIWAISDGQIHVQDFSDKLKVFARQMFKLSATRIHFSEEFITERELNSLLALNLYRICQEILNNAFKYAQAETIFIEVSSKSEHFSIHIRDNGIGFESANSNTSQYGLQNIRERAAESGIMVSFSSKLNHGTSYRLEV